jgi:trk system potassium uptake protein TrkA
VDIIIAGAGRVGFRLAKSLSIKHNVIIMDRNEDALNNIQESIDVLTIPGNVEDPKSYHSLQDKTIDIFIAVTDSDETNLISSIIASEKIDVKRKIIRLKNDFFANSSIAKKIGITDAVFPYSLTAKSIVSLLEFPRANNIKSFLQTSNKLISIKVDHDEENLSVFSFKTTKIKLIGIDSGKKFYIPTEDDKIKKGDMLYLFGQIEDIKQICKQLNHTMPKNIKNIAIFGADILGIEIAQVLEENGARIKLIEKDLSKCKKASEILKSSITIINSKYGDFRLYDDEGLKNADMIIASSTNDEENIIKCIEAKEHGVTKVIAINNDINHYNLMHSLGIVVVRGPKVNAYNSIMEIIGSNSVVNEKHFCGGSAICFIREIKNENQNIKPLLSSGIVSYIVLNNELTLFNTNYILNSDIVIMSFCVRVKEEEARLWINKL